MKNEITDLKSVKKDNAVELEEPNPGPLSPTFPGLRLRRSSLTQKHSTIKSRKIEFPREEDIADD